MNAIIHIQNTKRTAAAEREAAREELFAAQFRGRRIEWDPKDGHGPRCGVVTGYGRYDEGAARIGALLLRATRDTGPREGAEFSVLFAEDWSLL